MERIEGGAFLLARQLFTSDFWLDKPATWKIIWIYILGHVNHTDNGKFKRGEGFFNFAADHRKIGSDVTDDIIKHFLQHGRRLGFLSTTRSTRGTVIKVLNYDRFQSLVNYESTTHSTSSARQKHDRSTPINKNVKNDKNDKKNTLASDDAGEINLIMEKFQMVINPTINYGNRTQRKAIQELLTLLGKEKLIRTIEYAASIQTEQFAPTITTPYQLKEKLTQLTSYFQKHSKSKNTIAIIS